MELDALKTAVDTAFKLENTVRILSQDVAENRQQGQVLSARLKQTEAELKTQLDEIQKIFKAKDGGKT